MPIFCGNILSKTEYDYTTGSLDGLTGTVVQYTYDSWGKVLSVTGSMADTLGLINPFRYRGYYYDSEIGMYYLQSRYYDPEIGRFVNGDDVMYAIIYDRSLENNIFTYCSNDVLTNFDPNGFGWTKAEGCTSKHRQLDAFARGLDRYVKSITSNWFSRLINGANSVLSVVLKGKVAVIHSFVSLAVSYVPKLSNELASIRYILDEYRYNFQDSYTFKLNLLFGSHHQQFRIAAIKNKKEVSSTVFQYRHHLFNTLKKYWKNSGIQFKTYNVAHGFYFKK